MTGMTGVERIVKTLRLEEPDRVPFIEPPNATIREQLLPGASFYDTIEHFDLDGADLDDRGYPGYLTEQVDANHFRNQWGTVVRTVTGTLPHPVGPAISSEKDLETWLPPDPDDPARYSMIREFVRRYKGQRAVIASFADPFNVANEVRGAANHYMDFVRNPDLVDRLADLIKDYYIRYMRNCVEIGVDAILVKGDYATTKWPMLSREHFVRHVIPVLKTLVDEAKSLGVFVMKHTDGNLYPILDLIVDTGIHGLHPIDPNAGMDLGDVKEKYGHRICLMGNVDCAYVLTWGTVEEVREDVRRCIRQAARGGGYICMSSNSIHPAVKPENYAEMVRAVHELGQYPISI
jgi:uroporphyrinogen decarboxylase